MILYRNNVLKLQKEKLNFKVIRNIIRGNLEFWKISYDYNRTIDRGYCKSQEILNIAQIMQHDMWNCQSDQM